MENTLFTISEFAKISGINRKNLIYYDSIGLLRPEVIAENGYRYYSYRQIEQSYVILTLKTLDIPLEEIKQYLLRRSPAHGLELFKEQLGYFKQKIDYLHHINDFLENRIKAIDESAAAPLNTPLLEKRSPETYYISTAKADPQNAYDTDELTAFYDELLAVNAFVNYNFGLLYTFDQPVASPQINSSHYLLLTTEPRVQYATRIKPSGNYLVYYHKGDFTHFNIAFEALVRYAREHQIHLNQEAFYEILIDELVSTDSHHQICKLSIHVQH